MSENEETDAEDFARGFRRELKDAVDAALERDEVPVGDTRVIDYIEVKRIRQNPIHDYRVFFR
jgi:hypothetical protein